MSKNGKKWIYSAWFKLLCVLLSAVTFFCGVYLLLEAASGITFYAVLKADLASVIKLTISMPEQVLQQIAEEQQKRIVDEAVEKYLKERSEIIKKEFEKLKNGEPSLVKPEVNLKDARRILNRNDDFNQYADKVDESALKKVFTFVSDIETSDPTRGWQCRLLVEDLTAEKNQAAALLTKRYKENVAFFVNSESDKTGLLERLEKRVNLHVRVCDVEGHIVFDSMPKDWMPSMLENNKICLEYNDGNLTQRGLDDSMSWADLLNDYQGGNLYLYLDENSSQEDDYGSVARYSSRFANDFRPTHLIFIGVVFLLCGLALLARYLRVCGKKKTDEGVEIRIAWFDQINFGLYLSLSVALTAGFLLCSIKTYLIRNYMLASLVMTMVFLTLLQLLASFIRRIRAKQRLMHVNVEVSDNTSDNSRAFRRRFMANFFLCILVILILTLLFISVSGWAVEPAITSILLFVFVAVGVFAFFRMYSYARQLDAAKNEHERAEWITEVSHDLKIPLTSIINYAELLKRCENDDPDAQHYLDVISTKSVHLKTKIDDLVESSRLSSGTVKAELAAINLGELAMQAVVELTPDFEKQGLDLRYDMPKHTTTVLADGEKSYRILENLFGNACKYAAPDSRVDARVFAEGGFGCFELKNTACAPIDVAPEALTERFKRAACTADKAEGHGLGLSIAKSLAELQNGSLRITTDGDQFTVALRFPLATEALPDETEQSPRNRRREKTG